MSDNPNKPTDASQINALANKTNTQDISIDLSWIDMLKGIAIIGVFFDNWTHYMQFATTPPMLYSLGRVFSLAMGPFVQVFFILSGFGLTTAYFSQDETNWRWRKWAWRRITKIVIPYLICVVLSFLLGILGSYLYASVDVPFSWTSLLSHLTFTRNFYPPSWVWNPPLWFMPVIIGLYISFPFLLSVLKRWGTGTLLLLSALVTYGTLTIAVLVGASRSHEADLFTFWMLPFALGMALARVRETNPEWLCHLIGPRAFSLGVALLACSWGLRTYISLGKTFNDSLTSIGIFLFLLNLVWASRIRVPAISNLLKSLSSKSYLMYLVHYPIMQFLIGPLLRAPTNPIFVIAFGGMYIVIIFWLCYFVAQPIDRLTSMAYHRPMIMLSRKTTCSSRTSSRNGHMAHSS